MLAVTNQNSIKPQGRTEFKFEARYLYYPHKRQRTKGQCGLSVTSTKCLHPAITIFYIPCNDCWLSVGQ